MAQNQTNDSTRQALKKADNNAGDKQLLEDALEQREDIWRQNVILEGKLEASNKAFNKELEALNKELEVSTIRHAFDTLLERKLEASIEMSTIRHAFDMFRFNCVAFQQAQTCEDKLNAVVNETEAALNRCSALAKTELEASKAELDASKAELEASKAELEAAQNELTNYITYAQQTQEALICKNGEHERELEVARQTTANFYETDKEMKEKVADLEMQLEAAHKTIANFDDKDKKMNEKVADLEAELASSTKQLQETVSAHDQKVTDLEAELASSKKQLQETVSANLKRELEGLRAEHNPAPPAPPAEADRKKIVVKVEPPFERAAAIQINEILAGLNKDGKTFAENYLVFVNLSPLTHATITQQKGGDTENLQKAAESLMTLFKNGNYTCTRSSFLPAEPENLANMMQNTGKGPKEWEQQLQQEMDNKKAQIDKKKAEKAQERLDEAHLEECCTRAKWHYHHSDEGIVMNVAEESIIGSCGFDHSIEVDEYLAGHYAGKGGYYLMHEIAWANNVYCHLMDRHTKGRKKRLLVYGTDINRNAAMEAAKEMLKRVTKQWQQNNAGTHDSNTVGDHAAHALA